MSKTTLVGRRLAATTPTRHPRRRRLGFEALEDRNLMSVTLNWVNEGIKGGIFTPSGQPDRSRR